MISGKFFERFVCLDTIFLQVGLNVSGYIAPVGLGRNSNFDLF